MSNPKRPIPSVPALARIFNILGGLVLLAAVAVAVGAAVQFKSAGGNALAALPIVGALIFSGILYLGVAEVIQLIARIAIEAGRQADATERATTPAAPPPQPPLYLYLVGEDTRGPVSLDVLRSLRSVTTGPRYVTGETLVCKVGESDWKRLADSMGTPVPPVAPAKPDKPA
jgi:hypothetical protein